MVTQRSVSVRRGVLSVSMWVLLLVWLSTPWWYYNGVIAGGHLFGAPTSPESTTISRPVLAGRAGGRLRGADHRRTPS